ncbi:phosphoglycolate phosphatase [Arenimonas fontis]|uniref:phosphoglycolate phosphatase n=1 Tax=Arenimonas fontis TaxID=2608255 RepID=A0A5B2ZEJ5_9GAMM|nr:phosphoglycolate phosphatase [Arenimonas fontis]KAA2285492.1 phosphoglycolate phosphatase [Arenimonas fontis]
MTGGNGRLQAVLFDLDGTLVDSAPDLCDAMNRVMRRLGRAEVAESRLRQVVSKGGRAMLAVAAPDLTEAEREALLPEFLQEYSKALAERSTLFDGITDLLAAIEGRGLRWGIVTNKPGWLAEGVVEGFGWGRRCAVLVAGDTLPSRKPDPATLLFACERLAIAPDQALYVGDDLRDVQAARAAGMPVATALWGYREDGEDPRAWGADLDCETARELIGHLPA